MTNPFKQLRLEKQMKESRRVTLREISRKTGISNSHLSILERPKHQNPTWNTMSRLANYYGITMHELVDRMNSYEHHLRNTVNVQQSTQPTTDAAGMVQ